MATEVPQRLELALVTRVAKPPEGEDWLHEAKLDGYRILARINAHGDIRLITRNANEWTSRAPGGVESLRLLQLHNRITEQALDIFIVDLDSPLEKAARRERGSMPPGKA